MRRLYITVFTLGVLLGMLTGCQNFFCHTAGVCDCDFDDNPCTHRAPWAAGMTGAMPGGVTGCAGGGCATGGAPVMGPDGVPIVNNASKTVPVQPVSRQR